MAKGFSRQYPKGRISGDDDGQLVFGIAADHEHKRVLVNFFKPIEWFGLDFDTGLQLLMGLAKNLSSISGKVIQVEVLNDSEQNP